MTERLHSLDTLRSLAIILVLIAHIILGYGAPPLLAPLQLGGMGVDLFFVLSGWLLGRQLFQEISNTGNLDIRRFWYRRWIRTLPAYYAVLGMISVQQILTKENWNFPVDYLFFLQNYHQPFEIFQVSWSLAVEEQFYLIIAPAVVILWHIPVRTRFTVLLIALLIPSVLRYLNLYENEYQTHVRVDGCIAGVLLAYISTQHTILWQKLSNASTPIFIVSSTAFFLYFFQRYVPLAWLTDPGMLERSLIFSGWVLFAVQKKNRSFWRVPGANYIATRSYSLYLLHPEAIAIINRLDTNINFSIYFLIVTTISFLLAELLYRFIEKPFMNAREKIVP